MLTDAFAFILQCNHGMNHSFAKSGLKESVTQIFRSTLQRQYPFGRVFIWGFVETD